MANCCQSLNPKSPGGRGGAIIIHCLKIAISPEPNPVPPLWSGFPDFGPDPDFFEQTGPIFAQKSGFFLKIRKERLKS